MTRAPRGHVLRAGFGALDQVLRPLPGASFAVDLAWAAAARSSNSCRRAGSSPRKAPKAVMRQPSSVVVSCLCPLGMHHTARNQDTLSGVGVSKGREAQEPGKGATWPEAAGAVVVRLSGSIRRRVPPPQSRTMGPVRVSVGTGPGAVMIPPYVKGRKNSNGRRMTSRQPNPWIRGSQVGIRGT